MSNVRPTPEMWYSLYDLPGLFLVFVASLSSNVFPIEIIIAKETLQNSVTFVQ